MYRKKLMRACLTGLMVVTVATANVAPVFAAEAPAGTETTTSKASVVKAQFVDAAGTVVAGGDYFVDADGDGIFNLSELPVPEGYELSLAGDQFVKDYVGKTTQLKVKVVKAATMKVVYKDQTTQEVVGEETLTGSRQDADGNYVFDAAVDFNIPFGYQLAVDYPVETLKAGETKTTECLVTARETVLHITFETQDGEVVGTKTVSTTSQGADGECWTFMLGTDFDLPEGVDQITNIQIPFGSTGGHTMVVEKGDLSSIVKIQFVDAENNDEVVAGGDYFVDGDGDGIFHTREITEWVPEGYELQEVGDFQVELYKETPLQLSVTKIKEDKPETPDPEEPNKPEKPETPDQEKPEKPNKEDDKKEDKKDEKKNSPKTGDETNAAAAALPAGVSLAAILAVLVKKFK